MQSDTPTMLHWTKDRGRKNKIVVSEKPWEHILPSHLGYSQRMLQRYLAATGKDSRADAVCVTYLYRGGPHTLASMWHGRDLDLKGSFVGLRVEQDGGFGR